MIINYISMHQYLYLNSINAINNRFTLNEPIQGIYKLVSLSFTNNIYNVNDNNNTIYLNENGTNIQCTLTNGFYNTTDFVNHLSTLLNNNLTGSVSVSLNDNTNKLTITNTITFYFTFGSNTNNSAFKLLGFNSQDGTTNTTQTSDNCIDLNTHKYIFLDISEDYALNVDGTGSFNTSLIINGNGNFNEIVRYTAKDNFEQCVSFNNTKNITYNFHDADYNDINLNSHFEIILQKC